MTRPCQCTGPGWCKRHGVKKSEHWVHLCQTNDNYWQAWEDGRGPGQRVGSGVDRPHGNDLGPGSIIAKLLGCGGLKSQYRLTMNTWGPDGCEQHTETIVDWLLHHKACKAKLTDVTARRFLRLAIERSRSKH